MARRGRKKRTRHNENPAGGGWEIIYTGFVLILLCFFIMLSSFATMEQSKIARFVRSFANALSVLPGGLSFESGKEVVPPSADLVDLKNELAEIFKDLNAHTPSHEPEKDVSIAISEKGLVVKLSDQTLFNLGSAKISAEFFPYLEKVGSIISKTAYSVRVEGHTDNLPIHTNKFPSNWELSTARAVNVLRFFVDNCHIPAQRLSAVGFGEFQPLYENDSPEHRAKNRRVEIIFSTEEVNTSIQETVN